MQVGSGLAIALTLDVGQRVGRMTVLALRSGSACLLYITAHPHDGISASECHSTVKAEGRMMQRCMLVTDARAADDHNVLPS